MTQTEYYSNIVYHLALDGGILIGLVAVCGLVYLLTTLR